LHSLRFAPRRASAPPRPGVGHPVAPAGMLPRRREDLPSSWGISLVRLHMFFPTPAGLLAPDPFGAAAWPLDPQVQRLPRMVFRRPIARLSDSLSTLRSCGLLRRHARLASGCWSGSTEWAFHPQDSYERFQDRILTYLSSSPKLCLAQRGRPPLVSGRRFDRRTM
jgi:hypothetical protein